MRDGWRKITIGELCTLTKGITPTLKAIPGQYPLVVTAADQLSSDTYQFDGEAVCVPLVSSTGHGHASLKRVHYASGKFAVANIITVLEAKIGVDVDMKFLWLLLDHARNEIIVPLMKGTANVSLSQRSLADAQILLPPLVEQRRIVDLIESVDNAIEAASGVMRKLQSWLEQFRDLKLWSTSALLPLADLCSVDGSLVTPEGDLANLPHVGTDRIERGTGDLDGVVTAREDGVVSGKYRFDGRHVIYSKIRPNLRKVGLPNEPGLCSADAYPLLPEPDVPREYLQQIMLSRPFTQAAVSRSGRTKMPKINRRELMSIEVPFHTATEMAEYAESFAEANFTRHAYKQHLGSLHTLRSNLLTALLSGEHEIPESYDELLEGASI